MYVSSNLGESWLDLFELQSLDADNLPSAVYLSYVQTQLPLMMASLCLFDLESDNLKFVPVTAQNSCAT